MQHGHIIQFDKGVAKVLQLRDLHIRSGTLKVENVTNKENTA